jgi:hypothetical protein
VLHPPYFKRLFNNYQSQPAFLGLVRDQSTTHIHAPQLTHVAQSTISVCSFKGTAYRAKRQGKNQESSRLNPAIRVI